VRYGDSGGNAKLHPWQLYDMENDRSEQTDLANKYPDKVKALAGKWEKWAVRARVKPWPWEVE
jgi:arylsulfatase